jgi:hypothetical protein
MWELRGGQLPLSVQRGNLFRTVAEFRNTAQQSEGARLIEGARALRLLT